MTDAAPVVAATDGELEPVVMRFYLSKHYQDSVSSIKNSFSLTEEEVIVVSDLDYAVIQGQMDLEQYLLALEDCFATRLNQDERDRLYGQLFAERFLPLGNFLEPSAQEVIDLEELKLPQSPYYKVYFSPLSYAMAAEEIAKMAEIDLHGQMRERLRELLISKKKGVRIEAQVREVLLRGVDVGGLGLDPKTADTVIWAMNDVVDRVTLLSEEEHANRRAEEARRSQPILSPEEQEIAAFQAKAASLPTSPLSQLDQAIQAAIGRLAYKAPDEYLAKRLYNVISSRLRDVRSTLEVRQLLLRDSKVGGMGLEVGVVEQIIKEIEAVYQEFRDKIKAEEHVKIERQAQEQKQKIEERHKREAEEHARWFEEKIRARKTGEAQKSQILSQWQRQVVGPTSSIPLQEEHPLDVKEKKREQEKFGSLVDSSQEGVKLSRASADLSQAQLGNRPTLDTLAVTSPQLIGLVGELRVMSLAEFRRLAKDPEEAQKKVLQKIETLAQESFEKKIQGVQALKQSPLQAAYMNLVAESFRNGKAVSRLAEEKRAAGQDTLSPAEITAMIGINSALQF